jgi:type 1 fimbria pilin
MDSHSKSILKYIIIFTVFITLLNLNSASAQSCSSTGIMSSNGWTMSPPGTSVSNGQVIGSTRASITYSMPVPQNNPQIIAGSTTAEYNEYNAVPMPLTPGVGVRVKWAGYYTPFNITLTYIVPNGTVLSRRYWQHVFKATSNISHQIVFYYDYEIVIIDKDKYKGGKLIISDSTPVTADTVTRLDNTTGIQCINGWLNLLTPVTSELKVPELPKPAKPTCASAYLTATLGMEPIKSSAVAAYGENRSNGVASELNFRLTGEKCEKGTIIKAYFTDSRKPSSTENYLSSTNSTVGVRLYNDYDQYPIRFSPAPLGSSIPSGIPIVIGPATETSNMAFRIAAQYVRYPGVGANDIKAGPMTAATTVTFVYE